MLNVVIAYTPPIKRKYWTIYTKRAFKCHVWNNQWSIVINVCPINVTDRPTNSNCFFKGILTPPQYCARNLQEVSAFFHTMWCWLTSSKILMKCKFCSWSCLKIWPSILLLHRMTTFTLPRSKQWNHFPNQLFAKNIDYKETRIWSYCGPAGLFPL